MSTPEEIQKQQEDAARTAAKRTHYLAGLKYEEGSVYAVCSDGWTSAPCLTEEDAKALYNIHANGDASQWR